jgi:hypothetical protein
VFTVLHFDVRDRRDAHGRLRDLWDRVLTLNAQNTRRLASYYRVGFYGAAFEDLDGQEFVYAPRLRSRRGVG